MEEISNNIDKYILMGFGIVLALIGVLLFARRGMEGSNKIKLMKLEFELSAPSLVLVIVGCGLIVFPFFKMGGDPAAKNGGDDPSARGGGVEMVERPDSGGTSVDPDPVDHDDTWAADVDVAPGLSGMWTGSDGFPIKIVQVADEVAIQGFNAYGEVILDGEGIFEDGVLEFEAERYDGAFIEGRFRLTANGHRLEGQYVDTVYGTALNYIMTR